MENPVLNDANAALAAEGAALREQAASDTLMDDTSSATPEPEERASGTEDTSTAEHVSDPTSEGEAQTTKEQKPADTKQGEQKPTQERERNPDGTFKEPAKQEPSKYEKAKQREAEAWKKIEAEKQAIARERAEIEHHRKQAHWNQRQPDAKPTLKDERGFTAAEYEEAAKGFDEAGEEFLAKSAREMAYKLKQQEAQAAQQGHRQQIEQTRKADLETVIKAHPEFAPGGAKAQQMAAILGELPELDALPNSFTRAVQLLQLREEAGQVPGLKERAEKAEKEVARLTKLTSIGGGSPALPAGTKRFEDMTMEQQRDWLQKDAAQSQMAA